MIPAYLHVGFPTSIRGFNPVTSLVQTMTLAEPAAKMAHDEISQLFVKWNAALQTGDPKQVAKLYDESEGVLVPTVSNKIRTNLKEIEDYFSNFLKLKPYGQILESHVTTVDCMAIHSGVYMFSFDLDGRMVPARFSFVYKKNRDGEWKIVNHHSSGMPEN